MEADPLGLNDIFLDDDYSIEILLAKTKQRKQNLKDLRDSLLKHQQNLNQTSLDLFNSSYDRFYKLSYIISCLAEPIHQLIETLNAFRTQLASLCENHSAYLDSINSKLASLENTSRNKTLARRLIVLIQRRDRLEMQMKKIDWKLEPIDTNRRVHSDHFNKIDHIAYKIKCDLIERINIQLYHLSNEVRACQPTLDELIPIRKTLESSLDDRQCQLDRWFENNFLKAIECQDKTFIKFVISTYNQKDDLKALDHVWRSKVVKPYLEIALVENQQVLEQLSKTFNLLHEFVERQIDIIGQNFVVASFWQEIVERFEKLDKIFSTTNLKTFKMHYTEIRLFLAKQSKYESILSEEDAKNNTEKVIKKFNLKGYSDQVISQLLSSVETSLSTQPLCEIPQPPSGISPIPQFKLKICLEVYTLICSCWSQEIYIDTLEESFTQLATQILNRFADWLSKLRLSDFRISGPSPNVNIANRQTNFLAQQDAIMRLLLEDCDHLIAEVNLFISRLPRDNEQLSVSRQEKINASLATVSSGLNNVHSLRKLIEK